MYVVLSLKNLYGRLLWVKLANYPRVHMYSLQSVCEREYESLCEPVDCTIILSPLINISQLSTLTFLHFFSTLHELNRLTIGHCLGQHPIK